MFKLERITITPDQAYVFNFNDGYRSVILRTGTLLGFREQEAVNIEPDKSITLSPQTACEITLVRVEQS